MTDVVTIHRDGPVLVIGVDRPDKRNAWNREIIRRVAEAYSEIDSDPTLRAGVVFGHGEHFTAGLDLGDVLPAVAAGGDDLIPDGRCDPWDQIGEPCSKPIVVAVHGRCYTVGLELVLAAQLCVAARDTVFGQLEVTRGILPLGGGAFRLPSRFGAIGTEWLLTGREFGADEALAAGLVTEIVETGAQVDRAVEIAQRISVNAPLAVQAALANSRAHQRSARDAAAAHLRETGPAIVGSADAAEGMLAMIERRTPNFAGR